MANDITLADETAPAIRWSEPQLTPQLEAMLATEALWSSDDPLPLLTVDDLAQARRAIAVYRGAPKGSPAPYIAKQIGTLAIALPVARVSDREAQARVEIYQRALADLDTDVLRAAVGRAIETCRFFPTVAELREIASCMPAPQRVVRAYRLRQLVEQAERGANHLRPIDDPLTPEAMAAIAAEFGLGRLGEADDLTQAATAPLARPPRLPSRMPTADDYRGLGVEIERRDAA